MFIGQQMIRLVGIYWIFIIIQLIPFIALDTGYKTVRIIITVIALCACAIIIFKPILFLSYPSLFITTSSILINLFGYLSLRAFQSTTSQDITNNFGSSPTTSQNIDSQQNLCYLSKDDQTIEQLQINLRYFFGLLNGINFLPGINKIHRTISLFISVILWTLQYGGVLSRLISLSFLIEVVLLVYQTYLVEKIFNDRMSDKINSSEIGGSHLLQQSHNSHQAINKKNNHKNGGILYRGKSLSTSKKKWKIEDILYERNQFQDIVKKFATFNLVIYSSDMKMKFLTQNFKNNLSSQVSRFGLDEEESLKKLFQKINVSEKENLYDHIKKTMDQWYGEGQINSSFEMLCNRDRIYSLSNCQINLEKYQLYISEIQFDMQPCILILFNTQEDVSTFNQYKHKMINSISHDLKTPLNGMILLLDILKEQIKKNFLKPNELNYPPSLVAPLPSANALKLNLQQTQQNSNNLTSTCILGRQQTSNLICNNTNLEPTNSKLDTSLIPAKNCKDGLIQQNSTSQKYDFQAQKSQEIAQIGQKCNIFGNNSDNLNLQKYSMSVCLHEEQPFGAALTVLQKSVSHDASINQNLQLQNEKATQNQQQFSQSNQFLSPQQNQLLNSQYHHSKSQIFKYEQTMSTSLIPLQEEEENEADDQDGSQKQTQTNEEWLVQSSIKAATHNHLYHNNFTNFTDKQFFKFQSNLSPTSSSILKKDEQQELDQKLQQLKLDTLLFRKKSITEIKYLYPPQQSIQNLQDESLQMFNSLSSKNKVKNQISTYHSPEAQQQILSESHPFGLDSPINNTTNNCFTEQTFQINSVGKQKENLNYLVTTVNDESILMNKLDQQNQQGFSPDFGMVKQKKQKQQQQKSPIIKLQFQKSKETNNLNQQYSQDENFQIQENDEVHNQVKQLNVSHNHLQVISQKDFQNSNPYNQNNIDSYTTFNNNNTKGSNKNPISASKKEVLSGNASNLFNFQETTASQSSDYIKAESIQIGTINTSNTNHRENSSPSLGKGLPLKQTQKQQSNCKNQNSPKLQLDSDQTFFQQDQIVKLSSCSLQNKQNFFETTPITLSKTNTNSQNNQYFQSTLGSNKPISAANNSSPSSLLQQTQLKQGSNQQSSSSKTIQRNSQSPPSSKNQTPNNQANANFSNQDVLANLSEEQIQPKSSSSNENISSNQNSKQTIQIPKSSFSQFRSPEIISRKEINTQSNSQVEPFSKQPKEYLKFDSLYNKDRISEIEEKSIEGEQQSPNENNCIPQSNNLNQFQGRSNQFKFKDESKPINISSKLISNMQIQRKSPPSMNKLFYHSNTAGTLSSSNIPFNLDVSQRSFTYTYNENERKFNSRQAFFKRGGSKDLANSINPKRNDQNSLAKSTNQNGFSNTTPRDIKILYQYICNIEKNGYLLESRINDLIDYSTLLSKNDLSLNCTQFDLMEILLEIKDIFELQAKKKNCRLIIPSVLLNLKNDKPRIKQILINIIGNAIKFTFEGFIRIIVQVCESSSNLIQITVQDTGIGIPENIKKNILNFTAHIHQVKDDNRQGVGIGLEICSRLCQIIGPLDQEIQIESKVNIGSSFSFFVYLNHPLYMEERDLSSNHLRHKKKRANKIKSQLSLKSETEHENDIQIPCFETKNSLLTKQPIQHYNNINPNLQNTFEQTQETPELNGISKQLESSTSILMKKGINLSDDTKETVLIVDDVAFNLIALKNTLRLIFPSLNIIEAQNGKQAVEKVHEFNGRIDLVIMDINMPIMDGFQAMSIINQEIREGILEYVPIIAHTAFDNNDDKQKCFQLGAKGFLPKPVKKSELEKSVRLFLSSQSQI